MIITCPECATRYDLDDDRFLPNGRSVRCTACGESWFVPAPEPIEALGRSNENRRESRDFRDPRERHARRRDVEEHRNPPRSGLNGDSPDGREEGEEKDLLPPRDEKGRFMPRKKSDESDMRDEPKFSSSYDDIDLDDDADDSLFETPIAKATRKAKAEAKRAADRDEEEPPKGWRKGKMFYVEDDGEDDEPDSDPRGLFAKRKRGKTRDDNLRAPTRKGDQERESLRFGRAHEVDEEEWREDRRRESRAKERYYEEEFADDEFTDDDDFIPGEATIVDADWEDVDAEDEPRGRHFGRRVREERRRATALARMEDVRRFEPEMFDEEFFASLRVTPRELEKAVRKARRRAEARDKNRMTPWRAFGWSAWVAAIAGAAYAVVAYRDEIVKVAPSTAEAYAVVGIETDPTGLKIENVRHRLAMSTGGPMIEITGSLRNAGAEALNAPLLQAEALGPRGELLSRWTFSPVEPTVGGNGVTEFQTRHEAPDGVAEVALSFAPAESAATRREQ